MDIDTLCTPLPKGTLFILLSHVSQYLNVLVPPRCSAVENVREKSNHAQLLLVTVV